MGALWVKLMMRKKLRHKTAVVFVIIAAAGVHKLSGGSGGEYIFHNVARAHRGGRRQLMLFDCVWLSLSSRPSLTCTQCIDINGTLALIGEKHR